ncbi:hypothetical protein NHX12_031761 [Muraenolepis orangiensis]|uniref:Uncharacterized protein n=1 Tax=Muraenolepis orangiensis TaxID=630683 RepID=A0A9Q0E5W2_9TELE|nr:hypothetical protein NHX12_031761 [Muraenolepis orangiensis]
MLRVGTRGRLRTTVAMTSPMITTASMKKGRAELYHHTIRVALPSQHQASPPKPTDPRVYISELPDRAVYVRRYGGWTMEGNVQQLAKLLDLAGAKYNTDYYYNVYISELPDRAVYVRRYGGWTMEWNAQQLAKLLDLAGAKYNTDYYYNVEYQRCWECFIVFT